MGTSSGAAAWLKYGLGAGAEPPRKKFNDGEHMHDIGFHGCFFDPIVQGWSAEFELPIVYTYFLVFPHSISIFTTSFKLPKKI